MASRPAARPAATPAKSPGNAVATQKAGGALAINTPLPTFMKGHTGQGHENIGAGDIETPRIKLLQAVSPELTKFDEAKQGHFWHSVAEVSLGTTLRFVPVFVDQRAILWRPRWDGNGGILARADDGTHWSPPNAEFSVQVAKGVKRQVVWATKPTVAESGLLEWGSYDPEDPNSPPAATRMYNVVAKLLDFPDLPPAVITLQRSGIRPARKFLAKLKMSAAPSFGTVYEMGTTTEDSAEGPFFNYAFTSQGYVESEELFDECKEWYENFKRMGLQIKDLETAQDEGGVINGTAEAPVDSKGKKRY